MGTNFESSLPASLHDIRCDEACNRIAVEAVKRGCTDNVTVMIIDIQKPQPEWLSRAIYIIIVSHTSVCADIL